MARANVLVVDDEAGMRQFLQKLLTDNDYAVVVAEDAETALKELKRQEPDLVLTDFKMPIMDGLTLMAKIKETHDAIPIIMMTAFGTIENAIQAMKLGAYDYINKPFDIDEVLLVIEKALEKKRLEQENETLRQELNKSYTFGDIVSQDENMHKIFDTVRTVGQSKSHVLVRGETGTGKELIARAIHQSSPQANNPFITVDCAALTETLLESELFGHIKGAFTGATQDKKGLFEEAHGGTLFLDEIGNVSVEMQAKLLRVIQDGRIKRVGDSQTKDIDIRLIAATNEDLEAAVKEGRFREDLFYRLNVVNIELPPLRDRKGDIALLVDHFIQKYNHLEQKKLEGISEDALRILLNYDWPGNVRELENLIHRAVVIKKKPIIQPNDLTGNMKGSPGIEQRSIDRPDTFSEAKAKLVTAFEKRFLIDALKRCRGNVSQVAREVGLDRRNLQRKFKLHNITPSDYKS